MAAVPEYPSSCHPPDKRCRVARASPGETDRLDTELLKRAFLGWLHGESRHCSMAMVPRLKRKTPSGPNRSARTWSASAPGAAGGLSARRCVLSRAGVWVARVLLKSDIKDPVSGFFMMRSEVADKPAARLSGVGTKNLIDLLASIPGPLSVTELPYGFRGRNSRSGKLDWFTVLEYLVSGLLVEEVGGEHLPSKFLLLVQSGRAGWSCISSRCALYWPLSAPALLVLSRLRRRQRWFGTAF